MRCNDQDSLPAHGKRYNELDVQVPMAMYFGYMGIISYGFFCLTGTIGFFATYMFVRRIYAAVKID